MFFLIEHQHEKSAAIKIRELLKNKQFKTKKPNGLLDSRPNVSYSLTPWGQIMGHKIALQPE